MDTLTESQAGGQALVDALVKGQACALLVQNLERLDEGVAEEAEGVHNTLCECWSAAGSFPLLCWNDCNESKYITRE